MLSRLTLRLDERTRKRISRIAQRKRLSISEIVRRAIEDWADRHEPVTSPFER
jgi:predicted transcriptional regulator